MALKKSISFKGLVVADAYHRVSSVQVVGKTTMQIEVGVFADASQPAELFNSLFSAEYAMGGANPIAQAYTYIKTLRDFVDAEDC